MRRAVHEASRSVAEDGRRPHPKVGAVVVRDSRLLATGYRGERRLGEKRGGRGRHAEYGALEIKLRHRPVAGGTVFTTLEPCTTRGHPKIPCAERLVERRVARVIIGMIDPNPRISGKGLLRLREAGIDFEFFPGALKDEVEEMNREFIRFYRRRSTPASKALAVARLAKAGVRTSAAGRLSVSRGPTAHSKWLD
jgi:pyrimidine deaminase RibD-like protein